MQKVDDTDYRIIKQPEDGWKLEGQPFDYNNTVHTTTGENANFQFTFNGTFVQVFGRINETQQQYEQVQYVVDDGDLIQVEFRGPAAVVANFPNQLLFQFGPLGLGPHILKVDIFNPGFSLDYIQFDSNITPLVPPSDPPPNSTTTSATTQTEVTSASGTTSDQASVVSRSRVNIGGVAGGVIAAVVFLATLALFFLHWRKRQKKANSERHGITPFHINPQITMSQAPPPPAPIITYIPPTEEPTPLPPLAPLVTPPKSSTTAPRPLPSHAGAATLAPSFSLLSPITLSSSTSHGVSGAGASHSVTSHSLASPISDYDHDPPPSFAAAIAGTGVGRYPSMYKPRSMESLPPTEYGYGGGLMIREWSRPAAQPLPVPPHPPPPPPSQG